RRPAGRRRDGGPGTDAMTVPMRPTAQDSEADMRSSSAGPSRGTTWWEELAAAWAVAGVIALAVFLAAPGGTRPTPPPASGHGAVAGVALDDFENAAD